jgi:hypothetical protein
MKFLGGRMREGVDDGVTGLTALTFGNLTTYDRHAGGGERGKSACVTSKNAGIMEVAGLGGSAEGSGIGVSFDAGGSTLASAMAARIRVRVSAKFESR